MKKVFVILIAVVVVGGLFAMADEAVKNRKSGAEGNARVVQAQQVGSSRVVGTITYDTGAPNAGFSAGTGGHAVGNVFNSFSGAPLLTTGTLSTAYVFMTGGSQFFLSGFGAPNPTGTATRFMYLNISGAAPGTFAQVTGLAQPVGQTFLMGMYDWSGRQVGMDDATTAGQGFHAFSINTHWATPPYLGTGFATIPLRNALVRARGDLLVPVELMNFTIE
jgi:hypothetical protein